MCDEDDYKKSQSELLNERLDAIDFPEIGDHTFSELLYTASECGLIDYGISSVDALTVWKIVELAKTLGDNCPQELRM